MARTLAYSRYRGRLVLLAHARVNPSAAEWSAYCRDLRRWRAELDGILVRSDGGGPNALQRGEMTDAIEAERTTVRTAVVTVSRVARGIVTALSWINAQIKAFSPLQQDAALSYLGVTDDERAEVLAELERLRALLGAEAAPENP